MATTERTTPGQPIAADAPGDGLILDPNYLEFQAKPSGDPGRYESVWAKVRGLAGRYEMRA